MLENQRKFVILGGIFIIFLLIFGLLYFLLKKAPTPGPLTNVTSTPNTPVDTNKIPQVITPPVDTPPPPPVTSEEREKIYVKQLSRTFVERFETTSNQNDNRNVSDATALATPSMLSYIESKSQVQSNEYQGMTTKVISMEVTAFTGQTASVKIGAQQNTQTTTSSNVLYRNGRVELQKIEGIWKVSGLFWDAN